MKDQNEVVKCGCGLPMRRKEWSGHHRSCRVARGIPVTQSDIQDLEKYEERQRQGESE